MHRPFVPLGTVRMVVNLFQLPNRDGCRVGVVEMFSCPRISCRKRRSARSPASGLPSCDVASAGLDFAHVSRADVIVNHATEMVAADRFPTLREEQSHIIRLKGEPGPTLHRYFPIHLIARSPIGTMRSLLPLPCRMKSVPLRRSISPPSRLIPVEYRVSTLARSGSPFGSARLAAAEPARLLPR